MSSIHKDRRRPSIGSIVLIILAASVVFGFLFDFIATKIESAIYPKPDEYIEYVERYSERFGVPEELVWAVIKVESNFDHSAESNAGAVGLMQLTEATFNEISNIRLKEGLGLEMRYDPDTNIRYGTYYLSYLFARYENWDTTLAAYNGGLGNVDKWMGDDDKLSLDEIPYRETKNYVKKVNSAKAHYDKLY